MGGSTKGKDTGLTAANVGSANYLNSKVTPPYTSQLPSSSSAIAGSGTTGHYILNNSPCYDKTIATMPIKVQLPNGSTITSTHTCKINLPGLPDAAKIAHIFPSLIDHALLSIGQFCDRGCEAIFSRTNVVITSHVHTVLTGPRDVNGLWHLNLLPQPQQQANVALSPGTTFNVLQLFSPVPSTLQKAIKNNHFTTWPSLTATNVSHHLPKAMATTLGHLDQERKNLNSTKQSAKATADIADDDDFLPSAPITNGKATNFAYAAIEAIPARTGLLSTDQTGKFCILSNTGMRYVMILYNFDRNAILAEPLKNRTGIEIHLAYKKLHQLLISKGLRPQLQQMDNGCSKLLKQYMHEEAVDHQLGPPHLHRRNAAERAIGTWKYHFIVGLCSVDPNFPLDLWDRLIPQAEISLNHLRASRLNPKLSVYAQLFGNFDFIRTPMAPPGTRAIAHEKSKITRFVGPTWRTRMV
jgi:hypothetical protein